ncbi:DUF4352 domain-containing protein [Halalkalibacterium halodurans]|uniref:DUF4352 domain-containing protein n=1 Tax=Halalkalibacterium halodurans TaxID=86665 RepID=UPI001068CA03|nr:DUF4352 domain-containing protein [Halalkalibacterium halodurans]TES46083.1 DUF4352 domain-containing protein [Halalkalibacterium halodurans]
MKKLRFLGISVLLAGVLVACGEESSVEPVNNDTEAGEEEAAESGEEGAEEEATEEDEEEAAEEEAEEEFEVGVGDTVDFDGLHITVNGVKKSDGNDFETPSNDAFLLIDVSIENTSDESASISSMLNLDLLDPDGYSQNMTIFTDARGSLDGEVGPGRKLAGEAVYDVEDAEYYEFIFENPFTTGQAIWTINKDDIE